MKKLLALALSLASIGFVASSAEAKATKTSIAPATTTIATNAGEPQWRNRDRGRWGRRYDNRVRVTTQSRLVRYGRRIFRETYQIMYLPNGRTQTRLISRVRVR